MIWKPLGINKTAYLIQVPIAVGKSAYHSLKELHGKRSSPALVRERDARGRRRHRAFDWRLFLEEAKAAIERVKNQRGFVDFQQGFEICPYQLNRDHWTEGFVQDAKRTLPTWLTK